MGRWDIASNLPIATPIICVDFDFKVARRFSRRDFGGDFVFIFSDGFDLYPDFREDACFFAGIEGVIDGFFDGGEQGFSRVIEAEHVPVFGEELADGDFFL